MNTMPTNAAEPARSSGSAKTTEPAKPVGSARSAAPALVPFRLTFPTPDSGLDQDTLDQDQEWCEVEMDGVRRRIRFHDYDEVYKIPGLYEALFARRLKCHSPERVASLLKDVLSDAKTSAADLRLLDVGAGNGMVGEALRSIGVRTMIGVDILPEARIAALRDRPGLYQDYLVADLTALDTSQRRRLLAIEPNALSVVAALGYGDIPTGAFLAACEMIELGGIIAFNIKEDFLQDGDESGFSGLIRRLEREGRLQFQATRRYCHRLSVSGEPLHYVAIVATKTGTIAPV